MLLADLIESQKSTLMERWKRAAQERLGLDLKTSELINHLPHFVDDLVEALRAPAGEPIDMRAARHHGQHRMRFGIDIGALTEEMMLVGEMLLELAAHEQLQVSPAEVQRLCHVLGRGTAASVRAYAALRDQELSDQAARHFSLVAHDIRGPLQTARLAAGLLHDGPEADRERHFARLDRALTQVSELVDDSILAARLRGRPRLDARALQVGNLVNAVLSDVDDLARVKAIELSSELDPVEIQADHKLLSAALANLVRNAIKFSCHGGHVVVRALAREDRVLFEVEDECGGMPADVPPRLFQPFVQRAADKSGFGLGLLIVKQAAEAHNGSVRVANRPAQGCTFIMDLPLRYEPLDPQSSG